MPYIAQDRRAALDSYINETIAALIDLRIEDGDRGIQAGAGDLNYVITRILDGVYPAKRYRDMNEVVGILECAKMEFYRRIAAPYEDQKIFDEGDAYGYRLQETEEPEVHAKTLTVEEQLTRLLEELGDAVTPEIERSLRQTRDIAARAANRFKEQLAQMSQKKWDR